MYIRNRGLNSIIIIYIIPVFMVVCHTGIIMFSLDSITLVDNTYSRFLLSGKVGKRDVSQFKVSFPIQ